MIEINDEEINHGCDIRCVCIHPLSLALSLLLALPDKPVLYTIYTISYLVYKYISKENDVSLYKASLLPWRVANVFLMCF